MKCPDCMCKMELIGSGSGDIRETEVWHCKKCQNSLDDKGRERQTEEKKKQDIEFLAIVGFEMMQAILNCIVVGDMLSLRKFNALLHGLTYKTWNNTRIDWCLAQFEKMLHGLREVFDSAEEPQFMYIPKGEENE